jgi:hypothetical protein
MEKDQTFGEAGKAAQSFAWGYFAFHAQQRQTVFNFFLVVIGASLAAYAATIDKAGAPKLHSVIGCVLLLAAFLFWRLDKRSRHLVKLAEAALKDIEAELAQKTGFSSVKILALADQKSGGLFAWCESFTQIYRYAFALVGVIGLTIAFRSL